MTIFWLILFVILLIIEICTVDLVTIWFAFGALISLLFSFFTDNFMLLILIFVVSSILFLLLIKPILKKSNFIKKIPTNVDRLIGQEAEVVKKITKKEYGEVIVFGDVWTACSDEELDLHEKVVINRIDGVKLVVSKKEEI